MTNFENIFGDLLNNSSSSAQMEITLRKKEFENNLDEMWRIYLQGNPKQIVEYNKQVAMLKSSGLKILRNNDGKHLIRRM